MHFTTIVALASTASAHAISRRSALPFSSEVTLVERQAAEGDRYVCHENCGYALQDGRAEDDYCDSDEWNTMFQACLECALEFDIWQYYGGGLTPLAKACGLDATPVDGSNPPEEETTTTAAAEETTTAAEETTTAAEEETTTAAEESDAEETTTAAEQTTTEGDDASVTEPPTGPTSAPADDDEEEEDNEEEDHDDHTSGHVDVPSSTHAGNGTIPTSEPEPAPTSGAAQTLGSKVVVAGAAIFVAFNMM